MLSLLRIEWMKVKNYRTFWILLGITLISIPAVNYMLYDMMNNSFPKVKGKSILGSPFAFPDVWQTVSWNAGVLFLVPAILIITHTTNEFVYKTHRQNIIDGWSRNQFIQVKLVEVLLLSVLTTLIVLLTALGFGYLGNAVSPGISVWQDFRFVGFYFVQMLDYSLIAFVLALLVKRSGLAIGLFLVYMLVEKVIVGIGRYKFKLSFVDYLPEQVTGGLIPRPYLKFIVPADKVAEWEHHIPYYLVGGALYVAIYCILTSRWFYRSDL